MAERRGERTLYLPNLQISALSDLDLLLTGLKALLDDLPRLTPTKASFCRASTDRQVATFNK